MKRQPGRCCGSSALLAALFAAALSATPAGADDWPRWRGPNQDGTSNESGLPAEISLTAPILAWSIPLAGRGTPVIHKGRVFALGYEGTGPDLQEVLVCLDERSGALQWKAGANDFVSDVIYTRYAIGAPTVDPETGNVYWTTHAGLFSCYSPDGRLLWQHSMMDEFGRLTYPNGRTGAPVVDGDLVITRGMTSGWGKDGPARDRFHAFDKKTGELVWASSPCGPPKDNPYSHPVLEWRGGRRLMYTGTAGGHIVCVDVRTGDPVWRMPITIGGVCASPLLYGDLLIAVHGTENLDSSEGGRMLAIRLGAAPEAGKPGPAEIGAAHEVWRNGLSSFSSSPVLVGSRVYVTDYTGELACVNADTGAVLWAKKLAASQIHASPVWGDGKLYVPMASGVFYIIRPTDNGPEELARVQLEGECLGQPAIANGRVYVHTTERLYCFQRSGGAPEARETSPRTTIRATPIQPTPGSPARLQIVPAEIILAPGESASFTARILDANGALIESGPAEIRWTLNPRFDAAAGPGGQLVASASAKPGAAELEGECRGLKGIVRARIVPRLEHREDFESTPLSQAREGATYNQYAFPPVYWLGGRLKWEVVEKDGGKVLAQTLDNAIFQRTITTIGHPESRNYTMEVDIMSDGNRRLMSSGGVVNQRYLIALKGNHQEIEISSNMERIKEAVPFRWQPGVWYRLKTRVDTQSDGSAVVRAKAWPRDEAEPDAWNIEVVHRKGHPQGAPGIYGFVPQSRFHVYLDNITVTAND